MKAGTIEAGETSGYPTPTTPKGLNKGLSILDLILRAMAAIGTLASAIVMGTTNQTLPFSNQFFQFRADYNDLPTFMFFVIANSVACGYAVVSLPVSIFHLIRSTAKFSRIILVIFDTVMLALLTAGASAAASTVYLAHKGNASAGWFAICQQFNNFCNQITGSLAGSFIAVIMFMLMIITATMSLFTFNNNY